MVILQSSVSPMTPALARINVILEGLADGITVEDRDGSLVFLNPAAARLLGLPADLDADGIAPEDAFRWVTITDVDGQPVPLDQLPGAIARRERRAVDASLGFRVDAAGQELWADARATPVRDANGEARYAVTVFHDATARREAVAARDRLLTEMAVERTRLEAIVGQLPVAVVIAEAPSGRLLQGNAEVERIWRHPFVASPNVEGYRAWRGLHPDGTPLAPEEWPLARAMRTGQPITDERIAIIRGDGTPAMIQLNAAPIRGADGQIVAAVVTFHDVSEETRAEHRLRFVAETSELLASSLDYETTLDRVAHLAVPDIADWCAVDIWEETGDVRRLAVAHRDPAKEAWARELQERYPTDPYAPHGLYNVLRTGRSELYPEIPEAMLVAAAQDAEHLAIIREVGLRSAMIVPLVTRDRVLGAISFVTAESANNFNEGDLALAEDLARRAAIAVDNARLFAAEQRARQAAEQAARRTALLQAVTAALSESLTPDQVAAVVVDRGLSALGAVAGSVTLLTESGADLEIARAVGYPEDVLAPWRRFPVVSGLAFADAIATGEPVWLRSLAEMTERYPALAASAAAAGHHAAAAVPLMVGGRAIGGLGLSFAAPWAGEADEAYMIALARLCAQAIHRARLFEAEQDARAEAESARHRLAFLAEASTLLADSLDITATLSRLADLTVPAIADSCAVDVVDEDGTLRRLGVAHVDPVKAATIRALDPGRITELRTPRGRGAVLRTGRSDLRPEVTATTLAEIARDESHLAALTSLNLRSLMVVPLLAHERVLGVIVLGGGESGRRFGIADLALAEDLARRAAAALENARLYAAAQAAVRARDQFLSIAAHELRTPIAGIKGYAQMLQRAHDRGRLDESRLVGGLRTIDEASDRLTRLTSDLLDVSRVQIGQLPLRPHPLDLAVLVAAVVERRRHGEHGERVIEVRAPDSVPLVADGDRIEQVIANLLDNAVKYSAVDDVIRVTVEPDDEGVRVIVQDQGIGLPPGGEEAIFRPFGRAANATARNLPGLGLGLYICRGIVERHGGTITAESGGDGRGTTIRVWLPITTNPVPEQAGRTAV